MQIHIATWSGVEGMEGTGQQPEIIMMLLTD